jgi:predicted DNA-binding transcriptional regulator YafY
MNSLIVEAIQNHRLMRLNYDPGERTIEPHAYGEGKDGQELLRAFQVSGASASGEHVNWKLFRVDRINGLALLENTFPGPRPEYKRDDKAMKRRIYCQL